MIRITDCLWNVFAKFICTLSRIHWEPLRRHVYETGARHAELYKEGRPAPLRNVDGRHIEGIGRRCMPVSLQGMPTPLIMSTHFTRGQLTLNRQKMLTLLIMACPVPTYPLVVEIFSKSSSERVPSDCRHCRLTSDIFTKEFFTSMHWIYCRYISRNTDAQSFQQT